MNAPVPPASVPRGHPQPGDPADLNLFAVIVLYRLTPAESLSFRTLTAQIPEFEAQGNRIHVLLYDNTPGAETAGSLPPNVRYEASPRNAGLAAAYNRALSLAESLGCDWLLTLDQDTRLPSAYLLNMAAAAARFRNDRAVAAIAPRLTSGKVLLSPNYIRIIRNAAVPSGYVGLNDREMFALNSAAFLRVSAIRDIGGFPAQFWLHHLDLCLHHLLFRAGKRVYVAGNIVVDHCLSLQDYRTLSPEIYRWFLEAESVFSDLYQGWLRGLLLTITLGYRYLKQRRRGDSPGILHETMRMLKRRILLTRKSRIVQWNAALQERDKG